MTSLTQPAVATKAPPGLPVNAPPLSTATQWIALAAIAPSPFNPRKEIDKEGIAELAESIKVRGLLEPLVVRAKGVAKFELLAGHRRLEALKLVKAEGCQCTVIDADDGAARATLIVENLQRQDLGPMEEAEAFSALNESDPDKWSPPAIAAAIGKTPRFVQQRLAMTRNLAPEAKKALADGSLNVEKARVLATAPVQLQKELMDDWDFDNIDAEDLRAHILEEMIPVDRAVFDLALYKGEFHEEGKKRFFVDVDKFTELQTKAADGIVAKLRQGGWPTAQRVDVDRLHDWAWADTNQSLNWSERKGSKATGSFKPPKDKVTAVVWIDRTAKICTAEGVALSKHFPQPKRSATSSSSSYGPQRESADDKRRRTAFNADLAKAIGAKPDTARKVLLTGILFGNARVTYDNPAMNAMAKAVLPAALHALFDKRPYGKDADAKIWGEVKKLKDADVERILFSLTGLIYQWSWQYYGQRTKKPDGMCAVLADDLKVTLAPAADKAQPKTAAKVKATPKPKAAAKAKAKSKKKA